MLSKKRKIYVFIICVLIALTLAFIWGNSFLPRSESKEASDQTLDVMQSVLDTFFGIGKVVLSEGFVRKLAHFSEFFALGVEFGLLIIALNKETYKSYLTLLPIGLIVAIIDESIQLLSDRSAEIADVLLDYSGYLTAFAIFLIIFVIRRKVKNKI